MTNAHPHSAYRLRAATLSGMVDDGARLSDVERAIETLPVSGEEQSALWLWVIAHRDRRLRGERNRVDADAPTPREMLTVRLGEVCS